MIGTLLGFVDDRALLARFRRLLAASAVVRAATVLTLFPLLRELLSDDPAGAWPWIALLALLVPVSWVVDVRYARASFAIGFTLLRVVEQRVLQRFERLAIPDVSPSVASATQRALTASGQELCGAFAYVIAPLLASLVATVLIGLGLAVVSAWLGLAALASLVALGLAMMASGALLRRAEASYDAASIEVGERIVEFAQAQRVLRASGRPVDADAPLGRALAAQRRASLRLLRLALPGTLLFALAGQAALAGLTVVAVALSRDGTLSGAEVVALVVVAVRFLEPFFTAAGLSATLEVTRGSLQRIGRLLATPPLPEPVSDVVPDPVPGAPTLELRGVDFAYPGGPPVLRGVDLVAERGRTVAVVGPSGSGKSTLLAVAARLADPSAGTVLHDGIPAGELPLGALSARIGAVLQDVYLLDLPLLENIRLARPDAGDDEVRAAGSAAQLDDVVARLPDGWRTRVGEAGALLSGGERQRVSIARALLKRAPLLLLDEATSAVDALTERALVAALQAGAAERATIVVAHRLGTIADADEILFVDGGAVVERGTHAELLAAGGRFAAYWRRREAAAGWTLTGEAVTAG
jgi:ATP-binding cassette subfamily B protein IrtB